MEEAGLRVELEGYVAEVFASLGRKDQRAKGRLYLQGLMQPMAERLDVDHQQLQQFVTSSPWKVEPVRRRVAALAEESIAPEAWVIDDTGFKKDGVASACVARQYSGTLGKIGNCQVAATVHMVTDAASATVNWRLFVPEAWDDTCADTNEQAEAVAARRAKARIPDYVRHRPKWELALEMIDELTRWGRTCPVAVADAGYGDNALFRLELTRRSIPWVMAVKASTSAYPADTVPELAERSGPRGRPSVPRYRQARPAWPNSRWPPGEETTSGHLAARHQTQRHQQDRGHEIPLPRPARQTRQPAHRTRRRRITTRGLADRRMAARRQGTHRLLALRPARQHTNQDPGQTGKNPVAHRTRLPRTENQTRPLPLRRTVLPGLPPPRHPRVRSTPIHHQKTPRHPKSSRGSLSLYGVLKELQRILIRQLGRCPYCQHAQPT